ncbi:acyl-CoA thioesterase [Streptomyces prunicolor]|uniref:acyl-CoA thioesterase n=1 Tax=Streptomyces prunicolor TaxID=67348 RepID=UPI0003A44EB1|nr:hotdog domain-containing protein [Streptomyces prunicolor]
MSESVNFGVLIPLDVYFDDLDPYGMLHNSRYTVMVERAWNTYAFSLGFGAFEEAKPTHYVVKAVGIVFDLPVTGNGEIAVHLWTERVGRTSATTGFRVCSRDISTTYAHGTRTIVNLSRETMRPTEWSEDHRAGFDRIQGPEAWDLVRAPPWSEPRRQASPAPQKVMPSMYKGKSSSSVRKSITESV